MCSRKVRPNAGDAVAAAAAAAAADSAAAAGAPKSDQQAEAAAAAAGTPARLEITCEPEAVTFRDEGGRFNYLFVFFVLRCGPSGLPTALRAEKDKLQMECTLEYDDGSPVFAKPSKPSLRMFGNAGTDKPKECAATFSCKELRGSVRYKILKLSRNHDGKRFRVKLALKGVAESVVLPALTRPTMVLSKRKWLKAEERTPENQQRFALEERAEEENARLAREARGSAATLDVGTDLRKLLKMPRLEDSYPEHARLEPHTATASRDSSAGADDDEDASLDRDSDDESYAEAPRRARGKRSRAPEAPLAPAKQPRTAAPPPAEPQSAQIFGTVLSELGKLQAQIAQYNQAVETSRVRLDMVESENAQLRQRIELLEDRLASRQMKRKGMGALFKLEAPLALPRQHSLGVVGEDDSEPMLDFEETMSIFAVQSTAGSICGPE